VPEPTAAPETGPGGVRTATPPSLVGSRCPVCQERPLTKGQTVCSGRCRARRWRGRQAERVQAATARDREIRELLTAALAKLEAR
jgi:predicted nucleic acid-binding Zn ribbon protein